MVKVDKAIHALIQEMLASKMLVVSPEKGKYAVMQLRRGESWSVEVSSLFGWRKENLEQAKLVTSEVKKFLG